jgi:hypothetical protein
VTETSRDTDLRAGTLSYRYEHQTFTASTHVSATGLTAIDGDDLVWEIALDPRGQWEAVVEVEVEHPF